MGVYFRTTDTLKILTLSVKICDVGGSRRSIRTHQQPSPITDRQMELEKIEKDAFRGT